MCRILSTHAFMQNISFHYLRLNLIFWQYNFESSSEVRQTGDEIVAGDGRAPIFLDVTDDQFGSLFVGYVGGIVGIVHGVSEVAHENALLAPARHLADGEGASQNAHVGVHAHNENRVDAFLLEEIVDFTAVVGYAVVFADVDQWGLAGPGGVPGFLGRIAAAVRIVDGQGMSGKIQGIGEGRLRSVFHAAALGPVVIEEQRFGGGVKDLDAGVAQGADDAIHFGGYGCAAFGGAVAPVFVPHVADDDGGSGCGDVALDPDFVPVVPAFEGLDAAAQFQMKRSPGADAFGGRFQGAHLNVAASGPKQGVGQQAPEGCVFEILHAAEGGVEDATAVEFAHPGGGL